MQQAWVTRSRIQQAVGVSASQRFSPLRTKPLLRGLRIGRHDIQHPSVLADTYSCREVGHIRNLKALLDPVTARSAPALQRQGIANLLCALEAVRLLLTCNEDQSGSKVKAAPQALCKVFAMPDHNQA